MTEETPGESFPMSEGFSRSVSQSSSENLSRGLSNRHIQLIALGGAIGTGLFMGSGKTISLAGPSILLVYIIIGVVMFIVMRAMGEILLHDLRYKSFRDFAHDLINPWAGYAAGWTYWFLWVVIAIGDMVVITGYFDYWINNFNISVLCTLALLVALLVSNLLTVKLFGEVEFWFAIIKIVAIIALILVGGVMIATGFTGTDGTQASIRHIWSHGGVFPTGWTGFLAAFQMAIYSFIGTELIGMTAAEAKDPHLTIPKAVNAVPFRIIIFYVLSLAVIMSIKPWNEIDPNMSPFVAVFNLVGLLAAASVMNFVVLTSAASSSNSGIFSSSRMLFGLAKDVQAPRIYAKISKHKVPSNALYLSGGLVFLYLPLIYLGDSVMAGFTLVSSVASALILFIWGLIMVAYIRYYHRHRDAHAKADFKLPGASWTPYVVLAFFVFMIVVMMMEKDTMIPLLLTPVWFIFLAITWQLHKRKHPEVAEK